MKQSDSLMREARSLMLNQNFGVLSTISQTDGYPFGSVTPYSLQRNGQPVMLISDIAQHTNNIVADKRVSLTVLEHHKRDVQESPRLTILADATKIPDSGEDIANRHYSRFPQSKEYHNTHNFSFYSLVPVKIRYIGGFGKIQWLNVDQFILSNPFSQREEQQIVEHMNRDHQAALIHYIEKLKATPIEQSAVINMVGIDAEGFELMMNGQLFRFHFEKPINTVQEAREVLIAMAKV